MIREHRGVLLAALLAAAAGAALVYRLGHPGTPAPVAAQAPATLPRLDGVKYAVEQSAKDHQFYIKATGNVRPKSAMLQAEGFTEAADRKLWWKKAETPVSRAA